jgi:hypothetical protein
MSKNLSLQLLNLILSKLRYTRKFDFSTPLLYRDFGLRSIANPDVMSSGLHPMKLQNSVPPFHLPTSLWPHTNPLGFLDIVFHDFVTPVAKFMGLPPVKTQCTYPRVNPTTLMAWIYGPAPPKLRTFRRFHRNSPASL